MSYGGESGEISAASMSGADMQTVRMSSGAVCSFVATGTRTEGRYGLYRWDLPANAGGAGGHFHRSFSEAFYVIDGAPSFWNGRAWSRGGPGFYLYVPEGGIHGFRNDNDAPASLLVLFAPGAAREGYFETVAEVGAGTRTMSEDAWAELFERYDQVNVE